MPSAERPAAGFDAQTQRVVHVVLTSTVQRRGVECLTRYGSITSRNRFARDMWMRRRKMRVNGFGRGSHTFGFGIFAECGSIAEDSPRTSSRMIRWQDD